MTGFLKINMNISLFTHLLIYTMYVSATVPNIRDAEIKGPLSLWVLSVEGEGAQWGQRGKSDKQALNRNVEC